MKIWDALFLVAVFWLVCSNRQFNWKFDRIRFLKKSINKQVTKGNDLMADYVSLIELYYNNIFESIKEKVEVW